MLRPPSHCMPSHRALRGNLSPSALFTVELDNAGLFCFWHLLALWCEDDLNVARVTLVRVDTTVSTVCASAGFLNAMSARLHLVGKTSLTGAWLTTMLRMRRSSEVNSLASAFDSAFLSRPSMNLADLTGHRPCVRPKAFACAVRPTPPLKRVKGTHSLCACTLARNS